MKDYNQQVIPLYLYEWFCMEGIPYSGFVEELGYVLCEVIVTPTDNDCSTFGNTISYRKYYDFANSKCDDKIDLSVKYHQLDYQKNIEMPSWYLCTRNLTGITPKGEIFNKSIIVR